RRQTLRCRSVCQTGAPARDYPACGAEGRGIPPGRAHDPASGVRHQSAEAQTDRAGLRLDENRGGLRKLRHRGDELVDWIVTFTAAAYNLVRLRTLLLRAV